MTSWIQLNRHQAGPESSFSAQPGSGQTLEKIVATVRFDYRWSQRDHEHNGEENGDRDSGNPGVDDDGDGSATAAAAAEASARTAALQSELALLRGQLASGGAGVGTDAANATASGSAADIRERFRSVNCILIPLDNLGFVLHLF